MDCVLRVESHRNWIKRRSKNHWVHFRTTLTGNIVSYHKCVFFPVNLPQSNFKEVSGLDNRTREIRGKSCVISEVRFPLAKTTVHDVFPLTIVTIGCIPSPSLLLNIPWSANFRFQFLYAGSSKSLDFRSLWSLQSLQYATNSICFSSHSSTRK